MKQTYKRYYPQQPNSTTSSLLNDDIIYYEVELLNTNISRTKPIVFSDLRSNPFISELNDYYMSVIRIDVPRTNVGLFIMDNLDDPNDPNASLKIKVKNNLAATEQTISLYWNPFLVPRPNSTLDVINAQQFLNSLNIAINSACVAVAIPANQIPVAYMNRDRQTISFKFYASGNTYPANVNNWQETSTDPIVSNPDYQLFLSGFLSNLMPTLPIFYPNIVNYNVPGYRIVVAENFDNNIKIDTLSSKPNWYYDIGLETDTMHNLSVLSRVIMKTRLIPVSKTLVNVRETDSGSTDQSITVNGIPLDDSESQTLIDFTPDPASSYAEIFKSFQYSVEYPRLFDLMSSSAFRTMDFEILLANIGDVARPFYLFPGQRCNIKVAFYRKSLYNNAILN